MATPDQPERPGPPNPPSPPVPDANARWRYGLIVVVVAIAAIVLIFLIAALRYPTASDGVALVSSVATAISTLAAAYFGIQVGSAGKEQAEQKKDEAKDMAIALAADAPPTSEVAKSLVRRHAFGDDPAPARQPGPSGWARS
ncbi:hypothetical protein [Actinomycetospora lemnae]|uniref:Superfamily III holin-X n=1 Tax=Actinomycetospora lemnae TaxID=3019891 RepID=A0ABT5T1X8_9PSEU|nr:hypothetical protein [Actinomycetospora sp. DW7H6]MDD7968237.1 hypothetical protein [Actinomycetospora sp. DW7H6]